MREFRLQANSEMRFNLTRESFESQTRKRRPWFEPAHGQAEDVCHAVCPECRNPIRIIGLYVPLPNGQSAYGRHTGMQQKGFPFFDAESFALCPYVRKGKPSRSARRKSIEGLPLYILQILVGNFDHAIRILREDTGVNISRTLAGKLLANYLGTRGYLYAGASVSNTPWMLAYMNPAFSIFGQFLQEEATLIRNAVAAVPGAIVQPDGKIWKDGSFADVGLTFAHHNPRIVDNRLVETLKLWVLSHEQTRDGNAKIVGRTKFTIRPERFEALISAPAHRQRRNTDLLDIAKACLIAHDVALAERVFQALENPTTID